MSRREILSVYNYSYKLVFPITSYQYIFLEFLNHSLTVFVDVLMTQLAVLVQYCVYYDF